MRNVLRFEDECSFFTIHLVCRVEPSSLPSSAAPPTLPIPQHEPSLPQPDGLRNRRPVVELPSLAQPMTDEAQQLEAIREMLHGLTAAQGGAGVIQPDPVHYTPEQYIQIQQIYSQYMTLYSQYIQNQPTTAEAVARPPPAGENAPVAAVAAEEGPQNNDLLDYAYAVIRVMIMFCVMYVHSSFFTIHLVCRVEPSSLPSSSAAPPTLSIPQHEPSLPQPDGLRNRRPVVELPSLAQPMTDEAQQLEAIREMLHGLTAAQGGAGVIQPDPVHYTPEQYIQIQQIYSQYMTLYSQYIQNQPTTAEAVARPPPAGENAPVAAVAAEEGPQNNDLLDYAYAVIRVMIMFCVMYVHSSFFRLLFVAGGMLLAYFLQNRNRHQRQQQEVNNNNIQQQQGEEPVVGTNEDSEEEDEEDTEPKPNLLMVAFTFVTTLVSSIIPDHNQVVA